MNEDFRTIRNRLRKYRPSDIVEKCLEVLRLPQVPARMREYPPWFVLRLLEWTFLHGDHTSASYSAFGGRDFNALVRLMMEMNEVGDTAIDGATAPQLMKNLAHEQFPWRDARPAPEVMARNTVLFLELSRATRITERFMNLTGIPLEAFLGLSWLLWCHFFPHNQRPPDFVATWHFRNLVPEAQQWAAPLLDYLSLTEQQVGAYLRSQPQGPDTWDYRLHREPPLKKKPLLRRGNSYFPYSTVLLARALEHLVYEVLREDDPGELMKPFRAAFEQYIGIGLDGIGLPYIREADLRAYLPGSSKVVDYLVICDDVNVLIDAKCVEMHPLGRISILADRIEGTLRESVIKGMKQGNGVAGALNGHRKVGDLRLAGGPWHLIVVTYKNLYVGQGPYLRHMIGEDRIGRLARDWGDPQPVPCENVHFLSVDEFDRLVSIVQQGIPLTTVLKDASEAYQHHGVWVFAQVLDRYDVQKPLARHVDDAIARHAKRIGRFFAR